MSANEPRPEEPSSALRRTSVRSGATLEASDAAFFANRLTTLTHEMANLLDGSIRCLERVHETVSKERDEGRLPSQLESELQTVLGAMDQMAGLLKVVMPGSSILRDESPIRVGSRGSLVDAIEHAADVMRSVGEDRQIKIVTEVDADLAEVPAGPVFSIITGAIRNSIEAIRRSAPRGGEIRLQSTLERTSDGEFILLDIIDDGPGLALPVEKSPARVFEFGFTTKPGGGGVGLALAHDLVEELGGEITIATREERSDPARPGVRVSVRYPRPKAWDTNG